MVGHDLIVVGTSAGGVEVLTELARGLPPGLPAAILVVMHVPTGARSVLPELLSRSGRLLATHAQEGEPIYPGHIYVGPPDWHLVVEPGYVRLRGGPRENGHRPAIDPLFRSAARAYGPRVVGVVLTGGLRDGVAGLMAVRAAGGIAVVQDPRDAAVAALPQSAHDIAGADYVVAARDLAPLLLRLVTQPVPAEGAPPMRDPVDRMTEAVEAAMSAQVRGERHGEVSVFTCPECGGSLWQMDETEPVRFRCHVGHIYDAEDLLGEQSEVLEAALWTAVRTFREKVILSRQLAATARGHGELEAAERFDDQARVAEQYGELIRQYLLSGPNAPAEKRDGPK